MDLTNITQELSTITQGSLAWIFVVVVVLDIITGYAKAFVTKEFTSRKATDGLIRQVVRVLIFFATSFLLHLVSSEATPTINALILFLQSAFIIAYVRSLYENFMVMDTKFLEDLRQNRKEEQ